MTLESLSGYEILLPFTRIFAGCSSLSNGDGNIHSYAHANMYDIRKAVVVRLAVDGILYITLKERIGCQRSLPGKVFTETGL
ncbi:hypothetical protein CCR75_004828 [Bremia lactucae]|uniref:Uncharacterized protein n=1 Tax=Bremia lactucae TaxID=4779 RepID=A0A976FIC1_BRELC|nr:hypothetical protein CCR75_004828 [Bremia lactucae]